MYLNTVGLVLRVRDTAENDRLLSILTPEFGVINAFANGSRRLKSSQLAAAQTLCYGEFNLYRRRDTYIVNDAKSHSVFFGLRQDITTLSLAGYFCELAEFLSPEDTDSREILRLMLLFLNCLEKKRRPQEVLKPATELRLLTLAGLAPNLARCRECAAETLEGNFVKFDLVEGNFSCSNCNGGGEKVGLGVLSAMAHVLCAPLKRLYSFTLPANSLTILGEITEKYLKIHIPRKLNSLEFYHEILTIT
ncbi:MAG: DNA repair protein RecO [Oscillospiraceae bacterium]|nr:DNA repair protein RecO [Oscillospiraceae bacterium]